MQGERLIGFDHQAEGRGGHSRLHGRTNFKASSGRAAGHFEVTVGVLAEPEVTGDRHKVRYLSVESGHHHRGYATKHADRRTHGVARHRHADRGRHIGTSVVVGDADTRSCRTGKATTQNEGR